MADVGVAAPAEPGAEAGLQAAARLVFSPPPSLSRSALLPFLTALRTNILSAFPADSFQKEVVTRQIFGRHQIILNRPSSIRHVLIDNPGNYQRSATAIRITRPVMGGGLILADGAEWREQRRTVAPAFAPRMMPMVAQHAAAAAANAVAELAAGPAVVDLARLTQRIVLEVAGRAMFSLDMATVGPRILDLLRSYARNYGKIGLLDLLLPLAIPTWNDVRRRQFRRRWVRVIAEVAEARRAAPTDPSAPADLFDLITADHENGEPAKLVAVVDQIATMFASGYGTSAAALFWCLHLLTSAPEAQERIATEVRTLDFRPEAASDSLTRLPYTRAVVHEALRLYPPIHMIARQAQTADNAGGAHIPAGAVVMISPWLLHRHQRLWSEPDRFDPGRFMPGAPPPDRFAYLPFGVGPRICIGAQFALTETVLVLARLIQAFRIERVDDSPVTPFAVITLQPVRAPLFRIQPRSDG